MKLFKAYINKSSYLSFTKAEEHKSNKALCKILMDMPLRSSVYECFQPGLLTFLNYPNNCLLYICIKSPKKAIYLGSIISIKKKLLSSNYLYRCFRFNNLSIVY